MPSPVKVFYKGKNIEEDFVAYATNMEALEQYRKDQGSLPLVDVAAQFKVFTTHNHGAQGVNDEAGNAILDSEFGTHKDDDVVKRVLLEGEVQGGTKVTAKDDKFSNKNDSNFIVGR